MKRRIQFPVGVLLFVMFGYQLLAAQVFYRIETTFPVTHGGAAQWADADSDRDFDILLTGEFQPWVMLTEYFRNEQGSQFTGFSGYFMGVTLSNVAWGDYDNDGDLDVLVIGQNNGLAPTTTLYRNDGNSVFSVVPTNLPGISNGMAAWGDYDNDGDLDLLLTGSSDFFGNISKIYRNDRYNTFTEIQANLLAMWFSYGAWGDYDNDGDLDILLTGKSTTHHTRLYRNDGNDVFTGINAGLFEVSHGTVDWGDYDNDGDPDILLTGAFGQFNSGELSKIYRNDGNNVFTDINANLEQVNFSSGHWGDYDNDGDLDVLISGHKNMVGNFTKVYRNEGGGIFVDLNEDSLLQAAAELNVAWGDYDDDGDLDILVSGTSIYRNEGNFPANQPPEAPTGLQSVVHNDSVTLSWRAATDSETPSRGLSYNLRIGTSPGGVEVMSPMAQGGSGHRLFAARGNANQDTVWTIRNLPAGKYYWSVQAIDHGFAGSAFTVEDSFVVSITGIKTNPEELPEKCILMQNYPNPFNPTTNVEFSLPTDSRVLLTIYDLTGRKVKSLVNRNLPAGWHAVQWDGTNDAGQPVASGVYLYHLQAEDNFVQNHKMLLVR